MIFPLLFQEFLLWAGCWGGGPPSSSPRGVPCHFSGIFTGKLTRRTKRPGGGGAEFSMIYFSGKRWQSKNIYSITTETDIFWKDGLVLTQTSGKSLSTKNRRKKVDCNPGNFYTLIFQSIYFWNQGSIALTWKPKVPNIRGTGRSGYTYYSDGFASKRCLEKTTNIS